MIDFSVLASGSRANCIYVSAGDTKVLFDCGLSAKEASRRLEIIGVDPATIDAIVVSHEHTDHVAGVRVFSKKYNCKIYVNSSTVGNCNALNGIPDNLLNVFPTGEPFTVGCLLIDPFSVVHDACDPVGFRVQKLKCRIGDRNRFRSSYNTGKREN
jgi:phosphoribosyl 1,2-cyclic phosphodiesterase